MADAKVKRFTDAIVKDPENVPATIVMTGFEGRSALKEHRRLYLDIQLSNHVDVPADAILFEQDVDTGDPGLPCCRLWIDAKKAEALRFRPRPEAFPGGPGGFQIPTPAGPCVTPPNPGCGIISATCPPTPVGPSCPPTPLTPPCGISPAAPPCPISPLNPPCPVTPLNPPCGISPSCPPTPLNPPCPPTPHGPACVTPSGPWCPVTPAAGCPPTPGILCASPLCPPSPAIGCPPTPSGGLCPVSPLVGCPPTPSGPLCAISVSGPCVTAQTCPTIGRCPSAVDACPSAPAGCWGPFDPATVVVNPAITGMYGATPAVNPGLTPGFNPNVGFGFGR